MNYDFNDVDTLIRGQLPVRLSASRIRKFRSNAAMLVRSADMDLILLHSCGSFDVHTKGMLKIGCKLHPTSYSPIRNHRQVNMKLKIIVSELADTVAIRLSCIGFWVSRGIVGIDWMVEGHSQFIRIRV